MTTPGTLLRRTGLKSCAALLALLASAGAALAAPQYSVWQMSCDQARSIVSRQGAVVMYTAPNSYLGPATYERVVSDPRFCDPHETVTTFFAKSGDGQQCPFLHCVMREVPRFNPR